jgi:hypothetical protein
VSGTWQYRSVDEYGTAGHGLWADMHYIEGTPARHHYKGELVSLDTRPSPSTRMCCVTSTSLHIHPIQRHCSSQCDDNIMYMVLYKQMDVGGVSII